ncbi:MAG: KpsF/GutQ family sugar-phosphate isomerase [Pseudomonadota bacterium]
MDWRALLALGKTVLETEANAVSALIPRVGEAFGDACALMLHCRGRVVVTGMGKSGHIARKLAATLASAGTPAFFLHPGEASHGDLGMITEDDVVMALSNSGETAEVLTILPIIKRLGVPLITLTGNPHSKMSDEATVNIDVSVAEEACPLGLAPTASTTAALAMGDALAIALLQAKGFGPEDFARSHPGGRLGRRLLVRVRDIMHADDRLPKVSPDTVLSAALIEMTAKTLGMTAVVDADERVLGVFTDGDLRRALDAEVNVQTTPVSAVMTQDPVTVRGDILAAEGLNLIETRKVNGLLVVDDDNRLVGALNLMDFVRAGVM